jgi:hypothetical protein
MARTTLEMFIKLIGADKVGRALDSTSKKIKNTQKQVDKGSKQNAKFAAGMSGLSKTAIVGSSLLAVKALGDFSISAIQAASSAQEAAGAFGTTFGNASEKLNNQLSKNANLFGLTSSEAQQLISVFGSVAQGIGFTQEESADLSSELFDLAGDIASFNNITAGAAPVLQAFRSALVGEREALKTYGIAITEAEVQTKAFEQTGKDSADALTRQEKALATTALIFERSTVQQGNAAREASGFAAQMLIARSATTELQEEIGEELLPAAADLLGVFNSLRETATPDLITKFGDLGLTIQGTVEAFERGKGAFDDFMDFFRPDDYEEFNKELRETNRIYTDGILGLKGLGKERRAEKETTLELTKQLDNYAKAQDIINKSMQKQRQIINPLITAQGKYKQKIDKDLLPTLDKLAKVYGFINKVNQETVDKDQELEDAKNAVAEAQRKEALSTAEEALQKKQLQQEIAELTFFQRQGKDVTEELAVAQEKLKDVEFELTRESEELRDAKKNLADIESEVESAVDESTSAIQEQIDAINELQEVTELFSTDDFKETLEALADSLGVSYGDIFNEIYTKYLELLEKVNNKPLSVIISEQLEEAGIPEDFMIGNEETQKAIEDAKKIIDEREKVAAIKPILTTGGFAGEFNNARASIDTGGNFSFLGEDVAAITRAAVQQEIKVTVDLADNAEDFLQVTEERKARKGYAIR